MQFRKYLPCFFGMYLPGGGTCHRMYLLKGSLPAGVYLPRGYLLVYLPGVTCQGGGPAQGD